MISERFIRGFGYEVVSDEPAPLRLSIKIKVIPYGGGYTGAKEALYLYTGYKVETDASLMFIDGQTVSTRALVEKQPSSRITTSTLQNVIHEYQLENSEAWEWAWRCTTGMMSALMLAIWRRRLPSWAF